jgi:hypothetical protein
MASSLAASKRFCAYSATIAAAFAAILGLHVTAHGAIIQWDGGGANSNWNTGANWVSNTAPASSSSNHLEFGTVALQSPGQTTANNNVAANFQLNQITFGSTANASFNLTGSSIQFRKDGSADSSIVQDSSNGQTIGVAISLQNGNFSLAGNGTGLVTISGVISGIAIAKNGTSTYLLTGDNNALNANTTINAGTIIVGHANALDTNTVTVNNTGTLAIDTGITYTSALTLTSGSTLAGLGTYTPAAATFTLGSGVTVAPGISDIGALAIGKNTTFGAGSIFAVAIGGGANNNDRLNVTGTLSTGAANTLALNMSGADQGKYTLASATAAVSIGSNTSANGGFGSVTGLNSAYRLNTTATAIELIHKATMAIDGSPANATIITGGSTSISGHVANVAPTNSDVLTYVLTGSVGVTGLPGGTLNRTAGDANAAAGALFSGLFTGTTIGLNNVQVVASGTNGATVTNSPQSASFTVDVLDHASGSLAGSSTNIGSVIVGASIADASFNLLNAAGTRAGLRLTGVTSTNSSLSGPTSFAALAAGGSQGYSATINTSTAGALAASHVFDVEDEALPGATDLASLTHSISGTVLAHSNASFSSSIDTDGLLIDFGTVALGAGGGTLSSLFDIFSLVDVVGYTAGLDLDLLDVMGDSGTLAVSGPGTFNLAAGSSQGYAVAFDTNTPGVFNATYTFKLSDQDLLGATAPQSEWLTVTLSGAVQGVPEPTTLGLMLIAVIPAVLRRRNRVA